jgi:hypothetical protein
VRINHSIQFTLSLILCLGLSLNGCANQSEKEKEKDRNEPRAQTIRLRDPQKSAENPQKINPLVKKDLFNILLSPSGITVNGTKLENIKALKKFLSQQSKPVITIVAHRCYNSQDAAAVMSLAQEHTDTPIAYGSFGEFDDPECQ